MFDIGFAEICAIGIVALVVIGPERMPTVARTLGAILGRMQRYVNDVKTEVRREMQLEDLKRFQAEMADTMQEAENTIHSGLKSAEEMANAARAMETPPPAAPAGDIPSGPLPQEAAPPSGKQP